MAHTPDLLITGGTLLNLESGETRRADLRISEGRIVEIGEDLESNGVDTFDAAGKLISPGWIDMHVHLREPGQEHKETIATGCRAAAFGGFTAVACMPNTDPPIATRDVVEFVIKRAESTPVDVYPIAAVTKGRKGEALAELGDMADGGAVAFSDDGSPIQNAGLMRRALEYAATIGKPILQHCEDLTLNAHGQMHEGAVATRLGVSGIPALAEEVMIARDTLLAAYTGGRVHVCHISTGGAVDLVRMAKERGVEITAEVAPHHFALTDEEVERTGYDTHTKMHPPLRTAEDVEAIKEGLKDGTIDAIATDHAPHATFEKEVEFNAAPFGILGLETCWGLIGRELIEPGVLDVATAVHKLTVAPRAILDLPQVRIEKGETANLTIFDADTKWTFEERHIRSKSRNTPFVGAQMVGRAWAIYNKGQFVVAES